MMTEAVEASTTITSLKPYSMSRLTEYERCPRRFYFKYIEKIPEIIEDAGFFGSKVHEAISKALKGQDWQDTLSDLPYEQIEEAKIKVLTALKYSKSLGQIVGIETKFAIDEDFNAVDFGIGKQDTASPQCFRSCYTLMQYQAF